MLTPFADPDQVHRKDGTEIRMDNNLGLRAEMGEMWSLIKRREVVRRVPQSAAIILIHCHSCFLHPWQSLPNGAQVIRELSSRSIFQFARGETRSAMSNVSLLTQNGKGHSHPSASQSLVSSQTLCWVSSSMARYFLNPLKLIF